MLLSSVHASNGRSLLNKRSNCADILSIINNVMFYRIHWRFNSLHIRSIHKLCQTDQGGEKSEYILHQNNGLIDKYD